MKYHFIDDPLCDVDEEIECYADCTECPYFYDCMEIEEEEDDEEK